MFCTWRPHESSFIALLFVPCLSEHERPGAIGMLKAGVRVSLSPDIFIAICQLYSTSEIVTRLLRTVKGRHRPGQLTMATDIKKATNVDNIDDIYIDYICSGWLPKRPDG